MLKRRRIVQGYTDMGRPTVPPRPQNIVMVDRAGGQSYFLTTTGSAGSLVFALSTTLPTGKDTVTYGPHAGPYLNGNVRLYINSGVLTAEEVDTSTGLFYTQRVLARQANLAAYIEVTVPVTWHNGDALVYTEVTS